MRVTVYDKSPGPGFSQWFLKTMWFLGCWFQKLFGKVDAYFGAQSLDEALDWLCYRDGQLTSIQYWGHGSPGYVWVSGKAYRANDFMALKPKLLPSSVVWFRACSVFQGTAGHAFSKALADGLGCTVAGHTRIIGPLQSGLHTRKPNSPPSWPVEETEFPKSWWPSYWRWGDNTVTCLATKIPEGW